METKELKPDVKFTVINNSEGIVYSVIDNEDGKILYRTKCPATIAYAYADYWLYCTNVKGIPLSDLNDLAEDSGFLSMDVKESLPYLDSYEFITTFAHMRIENDVHSVEECSDKPRNVVALTLFGINEIPQLIDDIYKSETMRDIVNKMLAFLRALPQA